MIKKSLKPILHADIFRFKRFIGIHLFVNVVRMEYGILFHHKRKKKE